MASPNKKKPLSFSKLPVEPLTNLVQERIILAQLKKTNPEAYKILKTWGKK